MSLLLAVFLVVGAVAPALALPGGGGIRIDGDVIASEEVWAEYFYLDGLRKIIHARAEGAIDEAVFKNAAGQVLNRHLLAREAGRRGLALSGPERAEIRTRQVAAWKGEENFQTALSMIGISESAMLRRVGLNTLSRKLAERDLEGQGAPSEEDLRSFHRDNPQRYLPSSTTLRYVLLPGAGAAKLEREMFREAERLRQEAQTYETLVRRFSSHKSAARGGAVAAGDAEAAGLPHPALSRGLKPGRFSSRRRDEAGVHVYVRDIAVPLPFEDVRDRVRADLREKRVADRMNSLLERLRGQAGIELIEGAAPERNRASSPGGH